MKWSYPAQKQGLNSLHSSLMLQFLFQGEEQTAEIGRRRFFMIFRKHLRLLKGQVRQNYESGPRWRKTILGGCGCVFVIFVTGSSLTLLIFLVTLFVYESFFYIRAFSDKPLLQYESNLSATAFILVSIVSWSRSRLFLNFDFSRPLLGCTWFSMQTFMWKTV